jgi:response regulator RpfG family c-di-GMP phosphodiesterase
MPYFFGLLHALVNGREFYKTIKMKPEYADIPMVVITGADELPSIPNGIEVLKKPVDIKKLLSIVQKYCSGEVVTGTNGI